MSLPRTLATPIITWGAVIATLATSFPARSAILFYKNSDEFHAAAAARGHDLLGIEDYEDASNLNYSEAIDDPLDQYTDNETFEPGDILGAIRIQANLDGGYAPQPNPHGERALLVRNASGGTVDVNVTNNYGADSYDMIALEPLRAVGFSFIATVTTYLSNAQIHVWSDEGVLLGEYFSPAAAGGSQFVGLVTTEGENLDRVNLFKNYDHTAYVGADNVYAYGPASGHPLTLSAPTPGLGGTWNEVAVRGGTPGATVHLVYGRFSGATPIPSCPDELLIRKASVVAHAVVNDMGVATISAFVPARVSGTRVLLQAVQADACDRSDLIVHDFP